jgi:hypothetical protein
LVFELDVSENSAASLEQGVRTVVRDGLFFYAVVKNNLGTLLYHHAHFRLGFGHIILENILTLLAIYKLSDEPIDAADLSFGGKFEHDILTAFGLFCWFELSKPLIHEQILILIA